MMTTVDQHVAERSRADDGRRAVAWARREMPVLNGIEQRFSAEKPLAGVRIAASLHVTAETANLVRTLAAGGAEVWLCAASPLSTQDDVAAAIAVDLGIPIFAVRGEDDSCHCGHIHQVLSSRPQMTIDDGANLVTTLHETRPDLLGGIIGGTEQTTAGAMRLRRMMSEGLLRYPIIAVNDALTKHLFDNRHGAGQSTMDAILRATNVLIAGKTLVVAGYGWRARGIATRAQGMGANVVVTEINPLRALEAAMDGYRVLPMIQAASIGDIFVTATGGNIVLDQQHFEKMKDGAILANSGQFDIEVNLAALEVMATGKEQFRANVTRYLLSDGRQLNVLGKGRLVNLSAAEGHPSAVMDMSFAVQVLSIEYLAKSGKSLPVGVHTVPTEIDDIVARFKLEAMGIEIEAHTQMNLNEEHTS